MVVTLYIPPDTQTLAPKDTKRAPRKQPSYCQHFKSSAALSASAMPSTAESDASVTTTQERDRLSSPKFFIKGYEIVDKSTSPSTADTEPLTPAVNPASGFDDDDQNETCCTCMLDGGHVEDEYTLMAKTELLLNFDGYEMDTFGHLPGDSRTPTPIRRFIDGTPRCRMRRTCSPSTGQVIRVTMNNKGGKRR